MSPIPGPSSLPEYTASKAPPSYSSQPLVDETTLQYSHRSRQSRPLPSGTFTYRTKGVVVVLTEQDDAALIPVFDGLRPINGVLSLDSREDISEIALTVSCFFIFFLKVTLIFFRLTAI
jgi:hypothetical protein